MDGYHVMDEEGNRSGYGYDFQMCIRDRKMYMPEEERTGAIFHSVRIVGMTGFALNNVKRKCFVMNVKILNG